LRELCKTVLLVKRWPTATTTILHAQRPHTHLTHKQSLLSLSLSHLHTHTQSNTLTLAHTHTSIQHSYTYPHTHTHHPTLSSNAISFYVSDSLSLLLTRSRWARLNTQTADETTCLENNLKAQKVSKATRIGTS